MKHLGDITKINGAEVPVVDCVIGGSPCQELSIGGTRKGFDGDRSVLFMDQIRVTKEMREHDRASGRPDELIRPRYFVWENVPGAFSSGHPKGADFAAVLEEIVRIVEPEAPSVSVPEKGWPHAGCLYDELGRWSVAWRIHNGQHWGCTYLDDDGVPVKLGTPQRRCRIALVTDFGGLTAPEVLFERKGMHRHPAEGRDERKEASSDPKRSSGGAISLQERSGKPGGAYSVGNGQLNQISMSEVCNTLNCMHDQMAVMTPYAASGFGMYKEGVGTLRASRCEGTETLLAGQGLQRNCVRRLTPLEAERLQGFPDGWTDIGEWIDSKGKKRQSTDSVRYKALGNSICLPFWKWLIKRISAQYERDATMASLFDGIGGFPLLWEQINGKGSCLWASEIEEFPIAVTKRRFGDGESLR